MGRRRTPDEGGDAEAGVRSAKATSAANSIRRIGALPQVICDHSQIVTQGRSVPLQGHTALRIRGTARAEEDSALLEQSVELMASVPDLPLPMTLARYEALWRFDMGKPNHKRLQREACLSGFPDVSAKWLIWADHNRGLM